ncbi:hypothetical protein EB796_022027 [Bugula neritina]|uniref:MRPL39 n=1 Tax=Bugula neritina TaxID=10212 RepID=A0A7J7J1V2_BUGNE|nr:hypothetical protein EB796_022027 [Bugula neritina]
MLAEYLTQKVWCHRLQSTPEIARKLYHAASDIFIAERQRQLSLTKRVEKVTVLCHGVRDSANPVKLFMNKNLSTPYSCTRHLGEPYIKQTAISLVNGKPHHMHEPLTDDCEIEFLHFKQDDPSIVNKAFWRSCSFVLGSVLDIVFKQEHGVQLCESRDFPIESGSFAYDFKAKLGNWQPTQMELQIMSQAIKKFSYRNGRHAFIQPLTTSIEKAKEIFHSSRDKLAQLERLSATQDTASLYQMARHVDVIDGPLISNIGHIGRFTITAIHKLKEEGDGVCLYRAQGVALPASITMHSWTYQSLVANAMPLNESEEIVEEDGEEKPSLESHQ